MKLENIIDDAKELGYTVAVNTTARLLPGVFELPIYFYEWSLNSTLNPFDTPELITYATIRAYEWLSRKKEHKEQLLRELIYIGKYAWLVPTVITYGVVPEHKKFWKFTGDVFDTINQYWGNNKYLL